MSLYQTQEVNDTQKKNRITPRLLIDFFRYVTGLQIPAFAANASFFMILAIFPIIMLLLSIIKLTPYDEADLLSLVDRLAPEVLQPLLTLISNELYSKISGAFLGITGLTAVWSASKGTMALITGLNTVYKTDDTRNYIVKRLMAAFYMLLFVAAVVLLMLLHVFWQFVTAVLKNYISFTLPILVTITRYAVMFVFLVLLFMLIMKVFPDRKSSFKSQLPGAVLAAVGWIVFSFIFSLYVNNFSSFTYTYGSLAAFVLAMLWMYFSMIILFVGGAINAFIEKSMQEADEE